MGSAKNIVYSPLHVANAAGMKVLSIDYRLAPEHPFPAAIDDTVKVYRWLLKTVTSRKTSAGLAALQVAG